MARTFNRFGVGHRVVRARATPITPVHAPRIPPSRGIPLIRIRVSHPVRAYPLHMPLIAAPQLRETPHPVTGGGMHSAWATRAHLRRMNTQNRIRVLQKHPRPVQKPVHARAARRLWGKTSIHTWAYRRPHPLGRARERRTNTTYPHYLTRLRVIALCLTRGNPRLPRHAGPARGTFLH